MGWLAPGLIIRRRTLLTAVALVAAGLLADVRPSSAQTTRVWPSAKWASKEPTQVGVDVTLLNQALTYAQGFGGSGLIVKNGYRIAYWGDQATRYPLHSAAKSIGSILLGIAIGDGKLALTDPVQPRLAVAGVPLPPDANLTWWSQITVEQLATHTAGFDKPGGFPPQLFAPGTAWLYSDGGANWLADLLTVTFGQDLDAVLRARVEKPLQISVSDLTWNPNSFRPTPLASGVTRRAISGGVYANVNAMARIGLLMARRGLWRTKQIVPQAYVQAAGAPGAAVLGRPLFDPASWPTATERYNLLWWNNANKVIPGLPTDAFWAWGLKDAVILVVPSLDLVAARVGPKMQAVGRFGDVSGIAPFFDPLGRAATPPPPPPPPTTPPTTTPVAS